MVAILLVQEKRDMLYPVYTKKHTWSKHEANVFKIHVHDVCSKFASCLLHRVNGVLHCNTGFL